MLNLFAKRAANKIEFNGNKVTIKCLMCDKAYTFKCRLGAIQQWQDGALIQEVMPEATIEERELLISRLCSSCFNKAVPE
jgi:hypothetical protein